MASAGANQHTNDTPELSGIIEPLHFLSSVEPVPRGSQAYIFMTQSTLQMFAMNSAITDKCPLGDDKPAVALAGSATYPSVIVPHLYP